MGRPDQLTPSSRTNNNFNPVFHAQPETLVDEKRTVEAVNQPNQVMRPGQPTYINHGATVHTQPSNWTSGLFDCMNDGQNG